MSAFFVHETNEWTGEMAERYGRRGLLRSRKYRGREGGSGGIASTTRAWPLHCHEDFGWAQSAGPDR